MRPSGIAQGFKSWASKLHPQLPLTNQESSRLLNALTSAFREKLDEAHPRSTSEFRKKKASSNTDSRPASAVHSSAAHADKHLQSVLTNPLLGGRVLDYGTASAELSRNPNKDPVELLEEYHDKGAASVAIAELCLSQVKQSIERLPQDQRKAAIQKADAGRRVLKWLLGITLYDSKDYADRLSLIDHLVLFLVSEGREEIVWTWVKLNIKSDDVPQTEGSRRRVIRNHTLFQYRWRGRVLHALVQAKCAPISKTEAGYDPMNAAFDTLFEICKWKQSVPDCADQVPTGPICTWFGKMLGQPHIIRNDLDVVRFEKYIDLMPTICHGSSQSIIDLQRAKVLLSHPHGRQPAAALNCFRQIFSESPPDDVRPFLTSIRRTGNSAANKNWWGLVTTTIYALRQQGSVEDADWLRARCAEEFAREEPRFEAMMDKYRQYDMNRGARLEHRATQAKHHVHIPYPTFA